MGVLVKTAQAVENEVGRVQRQLEPTFRLKVKEAKAEWIGLKSRSTGSTWKGSELRFRAFLLKGDAKARMMIDKLIGRVIMELEKVRKTLPRA